MKNLSLLTVIGVFLSSVVWGSETEGWSVKSTEKQFEKTSEVIFKSSQGSQANKLSVSPSTYSKTTTNAPNKNEIQAKTLLARPEVKALYQDFWIFDAWVTFYSDEDGDGFFNHFSVEFDADTEFSAAEVYARLYLGKDEVFKEYHTTSNFSIFSDISTDSFVVESELLNGFASDDYEVLIELYDAYSHELVAVFDGNDDADLYLLSLESSDYESVQVVVVHEHGGSVGLWGLILLPLIIVRRLLKKVG